MNQSAGSNPRIILPEKQLLQSCQILFGPEADITLQFLGYLQPSGVKTAYRRMVMETHPDPAKALSDGPNAWPLARMKELLETLKDIDALVKRRGFAEQPL